MINFTIITFWLIRYVAIVIRIDGCGVWGGGGCVKEGDAAVNVAGWSEGE